MIAIVAALAKNRVIGKNNDLLWNIPEDLARFREITKGHIVLMGNKTFESIVARIGKPLPNRTNVVLARDPEYTVPPGVLLYTSLDEALAAFAGADVYVIGGGEIFRQTIDKADTLYLTYVDQEPEGDTYFPEFNLADWKVLYEEPHDGYTFVTYRKK